MLSQSTETLHNGEFWCFAFFGTYPGKAFEKMFWDVPKKTDSKEAQASCERKKCHSNGCALFSKRINKFSMNEVQSIVLMGAFLHVNKYKQLNEYLIYIIIIGS